MEVLQIILLQFSFYNCLIPELNLICVLNAVSWEEKKKKKECWAFLFWSVAVWQVPAPVLHTQCGKLPNAAQILEETKACEIASLLPCKCLSCRANFAGVSRGAMPEVKSTG